MVSFRVNLAGAEAPRTNIQAPMNFQAPTPKFRFRRHGLGVWCLALLWSLGLGAWSFPVSAADANTLVINWLNAQTNIHSWSADFVQTRTLKSLVQPLTNNGHVWFTAPNRDRKSTRLNSSHVALSR